jgi:hypothetical protein
MKVKYIPLILIPILLIAFGIYNLILTDHYRNIVTVNVNKSTEKIFTVNKNDLSSEQKSLYNLMPDDQKKSYLEAIGKRTDSDSVITEVRADIDNFVEIENDFEKLDARAEEIIKALQEKQETTNID